jgi:hypothetical protein
MNKAQWKFLRLRPANFPTIRIAQLAVLLSKQKNIFSKFIEAQSSAEIVRILKVTQAEYWLHHYIFGRYVQEEISALGKMSIENIIINTVAPLVAAYAQERDDQEFMDRAVRMLQEIQPENNSIIKKWQTLGLRSKNAFDTQGFIELHNNYCLRKRCLECSIGSSLIRPVSA